MIHEIDHILYFKNSLNFQITLILIKIILCLFKANYTCTIFFAGSIFEYQFIKFQFFDILNTILWKFFTVR